MNYRLGKYMTIMAFLVTLMAEEVQSEGFGDKFDEFMNKVKDGFNEAKAKAEEMFDSIKERFGYGDDDDN